MRDDYYYSGQCSVEQAEAEAQAKESSHRKGLGASASAQIATACWCAMQAVSRWRGFASRTGTKTRSLSLPRRSCWRQQGRHFFYMRLHKYADQAWADDLEAAITQAMTPNTDYANRSNSWPRLT